MAQEVWSHFGFAMGDFEVEPCSNRTCDSMNSPVDGETLTGGFRRSARLFRGFRGQYDDPDGFYTLLADDTVALVERYESVPGRSVIDVGGGSGYFAKAFRQAGATSFFVEPFWDALTHSGRSLGYGIIGDGTEMPFADRTFDISHSSNVIEHVSNPKGFFAELVRVVRPGGLIFLAFTNWFSPFGGHETSPWHYFGGEWAALRYERKLGYPPKNRYGTSLYRLDISEVVTWAKQLPVCGIGRCVPTVLPAMDQADGENSRRKGDRDLEHSARTAAPLRAVSKGCTRYLPYRKPHVMVGVRVVAEGHSCG